MSSAFWKGRNMKRFLSCLLLLVVVGCGAYGYYQYKSIPQADSAYEAAMRLYDTLLDGQTEATFFYKDQSLEQVYDALEAVYPFAFSLHSLTRGDGLVTFTVEVSRPARQEQARVFAQELASAVVTDDMDDREKLRVLHDELVRMCVYDVETASSEERNGGTAPFAADGALLDHIAVCAGYGRAYMMLCEAAGLQAIYIASAEMNHGWNAVCVDGAIYYVDCTFDDPVPDRGEYVGYEYFLKTQMEMGQTHVWDVAFYNQLMDKIFF